MAVGRAMLGLQSGELWVMEMRREFRIPARRGAVWAALADEALTMEILPGVKSIENTGERDRTVKVMLKVGTLRPTITAKVTPTNWRPPEAITLAVSGQSPSAGSVSGTIDLVLSEEGAETVVAVHGAADLTGKLAALDAAVIEEAAGKIAEDYFAGLREREQASEDLDHTLGAVELHNEPGEEPVEDKAEEAAEFAKATEERIEVAALGGVLGGPVVWGLLALVVVVIILTVLRLGP